MALLGTVAEISLEFDGDFELLPNGDLLVVDDSGGGTDATRQRITRLLMTNPRTQDALGNWTTPDDRFNPNYGAGLPAAVGLPPAEVAAQVQYRGQRALATDPTVVQVPAPVFTVTQVGVTQVQISVSCVASNGQEVTVPSLPLPQTS